MKSILLASAFAVPASFAAAADKYTLDPSHSQIVFSYAHFGASTTFGMFSGFEGEIMFDQENPAASSVNVAIPVKSMFTGWEARDGHFLSGEFFGAEEGDMVTFTSTSIEVTGDNTAMITGDLSMNDATVSVVLDTTLNKKGSYPFGADQGKDWAGFDATASLNRSDFGLGAYQGAGSEEVKIQISLEAIKK